MRALSKVLCLIDYLSEKSGAVAKWLALVLVLAGTYEAISRHFFGAPTVWSYDVLCMSGGALYLLGASYDYLHNAHTRVDLFYSMLSPRKKAAMDAFCFLFLFLPLVSVMSWVAFKWSFRAWKINEVFYNSFWYPPAGPFRTIFAVGLLSLLLQGCAQFIRDAYFALRGESLD